MSMGEPHVISSQAGLASIRAGLTVERDTFTIRTESDVVFELRKQLHTEGYAVIGVARGRQSITAEAIVGMVFVPGDNPNWYAKGYAQIVQRKLNEHLGLHQAFGIANPAEIITEVPL